ncbi:hypothetical protein OCU04_011173 [Sclerotinia nivalis]|uniref:Hydrophobin n=1 Tax=Sclerotinia nivalis TaxID=352851 RepID=A0A9X0AB98_9HELO|nr:hypothetical protein OCU04_011173 [Sclerotinia nivalis]
MHFFSVLTLASTAATLAAAVPSPVSNDIEKRQSQFCTIIGFTNPFCCIPQLDVINIVYVASGCKFLVEQVSLRFKTSIVPAWH